MPEPELQQDTTWDALGITPGAVLRVFGLRRSGNHAVINWLLRNTPEDRSIFLNNCTPGRNPLASYRNIEINGTGCGGGTDELRRCAAKAGDGAVLLFSYEDTLPPLPHGRRISQGIDDVAIDHDVLIYRGFLNWAASLVRKLRRNPGYNAVQRTNVTLRALELYGMVLELADEPQEFGIVAICYDDWQNLPDYRAMVLRHFGFVRRDDSLGAVQRYGGGSSFDGHADSVEQLDTSRRWRQMAHDPEYQIVLWLAAQDQAFVDRLDLVFPDDAAHLAALGREAVISTSLARAEASL